MEIEKQIVLFLGFWERTPSIGRKVGIPRGILPHVQTGLTNWNPDNSLSHPGLTNNVKLYCLLVNKTENPFSLQDDE